MAGQRNTPVEPEVRSARHSRLLRFAVLAAAYAAFGALERFLPAIDGVALFWPPAGIALAALWRWGPAYWPAVFVGAAACNLATGAGPLLTVVLAAASSAGPYVAVALARRHGFKGGNSRRELIALAAAAAIGITISAVVGATALVAAGRLPAAHFGREILAWWLGDIGGVVLTTPFLLSLSTSALSNVRRHGAQAITLLLLAAVVGTAVSGLAPGMGDARLPVSFLAVPPIAWAALRFGVPGSSLVTLIIAGFSIAGINLGKGPFHLGDENLGLFLLWAHLVTLGLLGLLATLLQAEIIGAENRLSLKEQALRASQVLYEELVRSLPVGVYRARSYPNGAIVYEYASPLFLAMLDLVPQEFPSTSFRNQILRRLHPDDLAALERANVDARATAGPVSFQGRMHVRGDTRWMRFDVAQNVEANGEHIWFGVVADVTDRRRIELQQASELSALEALAREQPLAALLSEFASGYEAMFPGAIASVLLVDPERRQLRHAAASRLADAYVAAIDGIEIGPLAGSFGAAASSGTTVIVEDIATDPRWQDRRDLAAAHGLAACWAHPLLSTRREVLGTIAVYYAVRRAPRPEELAAIERAAHLASFALERHAALLALAQSEARFRRFYNETPALLYSCDREGRFVSVSDHWLAVTGYARDEVTGRPLVDFVDADCRRRLIEVEQPEFLRTGQRTDVPFQLIGKRGARIDVVVSSTAERNADGVIIRSLSVMTDVTQRNRADAALRQHSENLDALHRFTLDLLDRRDMNDLLQTVVDRAAVMVSARFGVLLLLEQQRLTISACSRDQPLLAEAPLERGTGVLAWRAIDTRLPATIDDYAAWPERRAVYDPLGLHAILDLPVLLRGDCLGVLELARDVPGQPFTEAELQCGLLFAQMAALVIEHRRMYDGAVRELAERARAEMALREHEGRLAGIIESAIDAIITVDEEQKIIVFNRAAERTFGCTAESALGRSLDDFVPDRARVEHREHLRRFQASGETSRAKTGSAALVGRRAGGEEFPIEASISRVEVGGRQLSTVMLRDVADQRSAEANQAQLEAQLRESQKLEAIGTLAGGIAHDFNNIVGTILGNVELARQDIGKAGSAEQSLEEIRKAGHRARDLIRQIVAFSRNEPQDRRLVDLRSVVEATLRMLRPIIPAGTELHAQLPPSGLHVEGDPKQLQQVLVNLTANAWHALGGGAGRIDIVLDTLDLDGNVPPGLGRGRYAHLALKDSGVGMDAATLERIFEPFFTTREAGDGAGLGLSVVHGIVKSHHGRVDVASEPGQGSTFHVYLPLLAAPRDAQTVEQAVDDTGRQQRRGHVLYVDDDEALVFLATRMLARQGLKVTGHYRASDALAAIRSNPAEFDLLVTDYNMPGMSGVDLARHVAAIRADLPVVLTSGYITDAVRAAAIDTGIRHLVYKPNTVDELCDVVLRLLRDQARR